MTLREDLEQWLVNNRLDYTFPSHDDHFFNIEGVGNFLVIDGEDGNIVNEQFELIMGTEDVTRDDAFSKFTDYFAFKFGTRWYYTEGIEIKLQELRYLGKEKDCVESFPLLAVHGGYELCNGSRDYKDWCKKAKFCGVTTLAIAEENTLAGTLEFQAACEKAGIKGIIGETVIVKLNDQLYRIKLYVTSQEGWKNLLNINAYINVHNEEQYIEYNQLLRHTDGLICVISPEVDSEKIREGFQEAFHAVHFQVDVSQWSSPQKDKEWLESIQDYVRFHYDKKYGVSIHPVLIQDAYYLEKSDSFVKKELNAIGKVSFKNQSSDQHFKTPTEMLVQLAELLPEHDESGTFIEKAIHYTNKFSEIDFKIETGKLYLPKYVMTDREKEQHGDKKELIEYLIEIGLCEKILSKETKHTEQEYRDRIDTEMKVITEAKLEDYFLITWDILNWCKQHNIMTGYGRGSAAGCLVSYLMGIVQTDPLEYDLLFERFLNEGRLYKKKKMECFVIETVDGDIELDIEDEVVILRNGKEQRVVGRDLKVGDEVIRIGSQIF